MSNQSARNNFSSYYVEDLEEFVDDDLLKWDGKGHTVANSGVRSVNPGELTATKIFTDSISSTGGDPVCLEDIVEFDKQGTTANINYGEACDPNIVDINAFYQCKRDVNMFLQADRDNVAMNDDPNLYLSRDGNTVASKICMCSTTQDFKILTGSDTGTVNQPNITFYTGANYAPTTGIPDLSTSIEAMNINGNDQSVRLKKYLQLEDIAAPANGADATGRLYKKTGDDGIWWKPDSAGPEVDLSVTGGGDVVGPAGATNNSIARWDTASGKLLKDSPLVTMGDTGTITLPVGGGLKFAGTVDVLNFYETVSTSAIWTGGSGWSQNFTTEMTRCGNLLTLRFEATSDSQTSASQIISPSGFLNNDFRPNTDTTCIAPFAVGGTGTFGVVKVDSTGQIVFGLPSSGISSTPNDFPIGTVAWTTFSITILLD